MERAKKEESGTGEEERRGGDFVPPPGLCALGPGGVAYRPWPTVSPCGAGRAKVVNFLGFIEPVALPDRSRF